MRNDINFMLYSNFAAMKEGAKNCCLFAKRSIGCPINRRNARITRNIRKYQRIYVRITFNDYHLCGGVLFFFVETQCGWLLALGNCRWTCWGLEGEA